MDTKGYAQIKLPPEDAQSWGIRLQVNGDGISAGQSFRALFPDGEHSITLEVGSPSMGPGGWYISTPGFSGVCPVGLWVRP